MRDRKMCNISYKNPLLFCRAHCIPDPSPTHPFRDRRNCVSIKRYTYKLFTLAKIPDVGKGIRLQQTRDR